MSGQNLIFVTPFCVCVIGKEIPYGGNMGPGQGGSRSEMGLGGRKYLGRTLGPGQGGSQDYFAKKKEVQFLSSSDDNINVIIIIKLFLT